MFDYILSLGGTVFVPIIMIIIGLIFRIPWLQAVKAGVTVGIGFVGMGLVIVMAIDSLSPPIKVMIERFGLTLHVFDVGAGPASGVGYATAIGAMIIPVIFLLNVGMLVTRLTKTMNVDIYNYWHYAITGTVVQLMTGSLIYGVLGAICHAALSLKMADWTAKRVQNIVGLEGISIPQGYGSSSVPLFVLLDAIYEKIPFMKGRNIDAQEIQKRYGMVGDPVIIGVVLGLIFGLAAGEGFKGCATLMITVAAIMVLFPRMIRLIVEGLMPISDGARKFFQKHFKGREVFIGLDTAVTLGHPTTIAVGLLLIPIMLILASILPGNKVLPLADLPVAPFFICMATVIHRGDLIRTLLSGIIVMITVLLIATQFAPYFTDMALQNGGVDAVMFSNEFSLPYLTKVRPETTAAMARIIGQLMSEIRVPFGVNVLWDPVASFDLAMATNAKFIREIFTGAYASDFGVWDTNVGETIRHQHRIGAGHVKTLFNIVPEAAVYLGNRDVCSIAKSTVFNNNPDALCVSGLTAGARTDSAILKRVKETVPDTVVLANTGVCLENVEEQLCIADGCVTATTFKKDGVFANFVDQARVAKFMEKVRHIRQ